MTGTIGRALTVLALLAATAAPAAAQRLHGEASLGGMATAVGPAGGLYFDWAGAGSVLPTTFFVLESQVFQSNAAELVAMGGVRQQLFRSSKGNLYGQLLLGYARGYPHYCDLCNARVTQLGLGANVALNEHWAVRVRGDIRVGGSAADLFYPTLGAGVTRTWGSR
ncbi:MAG TPA: hypothetical protein VH436_03775 [Vicinamibacterales bacterium]|jgi:hypothetical protein